MHRNPRPDPYNGFKDDTERRRALNVRAVCIAAATIAVGARVPWGEMLHWLNAMGRWFH